MHPNILNRSLANVNVIYLGDQFSSYTARLLHDLGANVTKLVDADYTPAPHEDHYLAGITLEETDSVIERAKDRAKDADIIINSPLAGEGWPVLSAEQVEQLHADNPRQVIATITPYGMTGPWAGRPASDLTLLAAGGFLGSCGYDDGEEAGMPMAPTGGQANHVAGMLTTIAILAELTQLQTDEQAAVEPLDISVQHALSVSTEMAIPYWDYTDREVERHTGRHAMPVKTAKWQHKAADGKYFLALPLYVDDKRYADFRQWMRDEGFDDVVESDKLTEDAYRSQNQPELVEQFRELVNHRNSGWLFTEGQRRRLPWAPINTADECIDDSHFATFRTSIEEIDGSRRARSPFLIEEAQVQNPQSDEEK